MFLRWGIQPAKERNFKKNNVNGPQQQCQHRHNMLPYAVYVRQTMLASFLVKFWEHNNIVFLICSIFFKETGTKWTIFTQLVAKKNPKWQDNESESDEWVFTWEVSLALNGMNVVSLKTMKKTYGDMSSGKSPDTFISTASASSSSSSSSAAAAATEKRCVQRR